MPDILVMVKLAERCNIECDYCYMYTGVDQGWRTRPAKLAEGNSTALARRLEEFRSTHPGSKIMLEIHGGEPLLVGKSNMRKFLGDVRASLPPSDLHICAQTNAVLLDPEWLSIFDEYQGTISISCDGPPEIHDRHRVRYDGSGTGQAVEKAIRLCLEHPRSDELFSGVLAVAEPTYDSRRIVRYFRDLGVTNFDFLLPDANYIHPPKHVRDYSHPMMLRFLENAFDEWMAIDDPDFTIRMFSNFIRGIFGRRSTLDAFGGDLWPIVVVESDGSYRLLDVLAICEEGVTETNLHVTTDTLSKYLDYTRSYYPPPSATCRNCEAFTACGGGYLAHRFDGKSYDNPSFYCEVFLGIYRPIRGHL